MMVMFLDHFDMIDEENLGDSHLKNVDETRPENGEQFSRALQLINSLALVLMNLLCTTNSVMTFTEYVEVSKD
jgi:hypothetical protein